MAAGVGFGHAIVPAAFAGGFYRNPSALDHVAARSMTEFAQYESQSMPLHVRLEEPTPLHSTGFGLEQDAVLDVLQTCNKKLLFRFRW